MISQCFTIFKKYPSRRAVFVVESRKRGMAVVTLETVLLDKLLFEKVRWEIKVTDSSNSGLQDQWRWSTAFKEHYEWWTS